MNIDSLKPASLIATAQKKTGLRDFGKKEFLPFLNCLCNALRYEARLNKAGIYTHTQRLIDILTSRMQVEDYYRRYPEIDYEIVAPPLVITGLPRTGSTLLQRLIANDPQFLSAAYWENRFPAPFVNEGAVDPTPRIEAAKTEVATMLNAVPQLASVHPLDAEAADEEILLLEQSLCSTNSQALVNIPSFAQWQEQQDQRIGYAYLKKLLKFIQWQKRQRGKKGRRWILKTPHHLHCIDTLFDTFPGAQIIQTHRNPLVTIPSITSFTYFLFKLSSDEVDPMVVADSWNKKWIKGLKHSLNFYTTTPYTNVLDVAYTEMIKRPLDVLKKVYQFCGFELSKEGLSSAKLFLQLNDRNKRPIHQYSAETFGFKESRLKQQYQFYCDAYVNYIR
ncbi:MAG: sulfotransferase [Gammaproteobacteria bacterium]|nr:sulfotransferase [Gammaproteobacteria bacterium]